MAVLDAHAGGAQGGLRDEMGISTGFTARLRRITPWLLTCASGTAARLIDEVRPRPHGLEISCADSTVAAALGLTLPPNAPVSITLTAL